MSIIVAGERSGVGKTTVTLALLSCLSRRELAVQSFKVGPDYIDPMFHRHVTQRSCRNLDPVLTSEAYVQECFARHSQDVAYALVEGVMGLFDGAADRPGFASTAHIARLLNLPVLLVLDCSRMSHSIAALVHGYRSFDPQIQLAGVVLNRVGSDRHLEILKSALSPLQIPILGVLRRDDRVQIPDRHLGLIPTAELPNLQPVIDQLAHLGETCFDWSALTPLLKTTPHLPHLLHLPHLSPTVRIAIAHDPAFSFYYADNLDLLQTLGAELVFWSPLQDRELPENIQGLYFGGGFPEMFAATLADNQAIQAAVRSQIQAGIPTYAECGGLMYLCQQMVDFEQNAFPMVGILPTTAVMGKRLTLGYRHAIAQHDTPLVTTGQTIWGHEFHRSHLTIAPPDPLFHILPASPNLRSSDFPISPSPHLPISEGWHLPNLHASYIHLHWGACPELPTRFLRQCKIKMKS